MNELSAQSYIIVCRQMGIHYISKEQADKLKALINTHDGPKSIELNDSLIMLSDIVGVVTAQMYDEIQHRRKGDWLCSSNIWHKRDETCSCNWGKMPRVRGEYIPDDREMNISPEEAQKNKIILKLIKKRHATFKDHKTLKNKTITELESMLKSV